MERFMKKKLATLLLAMGLCIPCSMALSGCGETENNGNNNNGNNVENVFVIGATVTIPETSVYYQYWDAANNRFNFPKNFQWNFTSDDFEVTLNMNNNTSQIANPGDYRVQQDDWYVTGEDYLEYYVHFYYENNEYGSISVRVDNSREALPMLVGITKHADGYYVLDEEIRYHQRQKHISSSPHQYLKILHLESSDERGI